MNIMVLELLLLLMLLFVEKECTTWFKSASSYVITYLAIELAVETDMINQISKCKTN